VSFFTFLTALLRRWCVVHVNHVVRWHDCATTSASYLWPRGSMTGRKQASKQARGTRRTKQLRRGRFMSCCSFFLASLSDHQKGLIAECQWPTALSHHNLGGPKLRTLLVCSYVEKPKLICVTSLNWKSVKLVSLFVSWLIYCWSASKIIHINCDFS